MTDFVCRPGGTVNGLIRVPGDKSISHRSIILSSIAEGRSVISGFLEGEDSLNTLRAFQAMGVSIERNADRVNVDGVGLHGLKKPESVLDMGNSGTAMRLLLGLLAGQEFGTILTGDASLSKRPMNRVIDPLRAMNAKINCRAGGFAPLEVHAQTHLAAIDYRMPIASAQVKSCLLLASLYVRGKSTISEPAPTRDHTERMLRSFGCEVVTNGVDISINGGQKLYARNIEIPADISSAAFFLVAASIAPKSDITLQHVGINPTRTGVIEILNLMGADITLFNEREIGGEPIADIRVRSALLKGVKVPESLVPLAIDEFPVIFIAAACAEGETRLSGAEELRVKESDRIQVMADGLSTLGIRAKPGADGMRILGGQIGGGEVDSHGDHRIAMAAAIIALNCEKEVIIKNPICVNKSYPDFYLDLKSVITK